MRLAFTGGKPVRGDLVRSAGSPRAIGAVALVVCFLVMLAQTQPSMGVGRRATGATPTSEPSAGAAAASAARAGTGPAAPRPARLPSPATTLPAGWERSGDVMATVQGDASGLHVLVADERSAYSWRTVATLGDPGVETTQWVGQGCVTASGRYMVVVYAPRQVTNMAGEMGVLARAAIVNLATGATRQLGGGYSVAYFDPGCGTGEDAVLTRGGWGGDTPGLPASTGLEMVDAATGKTVSDVTVAGQATSAVPYEGSVVAAYRQGIARFGANGRYRILARTRAVPFRMVPDGSGGLGYEVLHGNQVNLYRLAGGRVSLAGSAPERSVQLVGSGGKAWLTGPGAARIRGLPAAWRPLNVAAGSVISTTGELAVTGTASGARTGAARADPTAALPVTVSAQVLSGMRPHEDFSVPASAAGPAPLARAGGRPSSGTRQGGPRAAAGPAVTAASSASPATTTTSPDRTCAISVDDPSVQAYQPAFNQVEWAADQAVHGDLTSTRPAGLYGSALPSYTPDALFPNWKLTGGGTVPAQVLLGVLTQESNLQQASVHVIQGQTSNPLTSFNWFGNWVDNNDEYTEGNTVDWAAADCGYGIGQITTGMCLAQGRNHDSECTYGQPMSATSQLAVAVDYQANIAAAVQDLASDWDQLAADGMTISGVIDGTTYTGPQYISDWYMALWAYNSGLEPNAANGNTTGCTPGPDCTDASGNGPGGNWGLGYADNPVNPAYPPDRPVFPSSSSSGYQTPDGGSYSPSWDMSHPQYWTYQEKVLSWAFDAVTLYNYNTGTDQQAFAYASGNPAYPPLTDFCDPDDDNCDPTFVDNTQPTASGGDPCQLSNDHCWWHVASPNPIACNGSCGAEKLTYSLGSAAPANPTIAAQFQEACSTAPLPSDAVIVGEDSPGGGSCPGQNWTEAAPMTWQFGADTSTSPATYPSKIYFDQIGAGFGGHFWFSYTIPNISKAASDPPGTQPSPVPAPGDSALQITGTWPAPSSVSGWTNILVHIPSYGALDPQAEYQISTSGSATPTDRIVNQNQQQNTWVSLGTFDLSSGAAVSLSNVTFSGLGQDIAWNGLAYVPSQAPAYDYVALGDSYSSGQGLPPYQPDSAYDNTSTGGIASNCDRSQTQAYPDLVDLPGTSEPVATAASVPGSGDEFDFLACNGQWTTQITETAADNSVPYGQVDQAPDANVPAWDAYSLGYDELPQADTGYLNASTSLVSITSGGDDARFVKVLTACFEAEAESIATAGITDDCTNGYTIPGDPKPADVYEGQVISDLGPHLLQDYKEIAALAPNAEIIVIDYPNLFDGDTQATGCVTNLVDPANASLFDEWGDDMRTAIEQAVHQAIADGINISMINADPAFSGHKICDSDNWINGITATNGSAVVGPGSFHPTAQGEQEFATLVNECVDSDIPAADLITSAGTCGETF
jgi:hypothetical protein